MNPWPFRPQVAILTLRFPHARRASRGGTCLDLLEVAGYRVYRLADIGELCAHARAERTLILLESSPLPGAGGEDDMFAACARLRASTQAPILLIAGTDAPDRVRGWCSGADVCLSTPVTPDELHAVIHVLTQGSRATADESLAVQEWPDGRPAVSTAGFPHGYDGGMPPPGSFDTASPDGTRTVVHHP
jgi:DNA-binding response OmpR family regulator